MADRKISDLTALTTPASGDFLLIVDISEAAAATKNKRITIEELMRGMPDGIAAAPSIAFESDPNTGIYSPGADQVAISTNGTGRLFVDASGNINLGQASSALQSGGTGLTIYGSAYSEIKFLNSTTGATLTDGTALVADSVNFSINNREAGDIIFRTSNTERMRLDSSGRLGLGTSSPTTLLDVNADTIRVRTARTPASASATGATGEICWDANYIYVCTATNIWKRTAISTW